jgi:hypothetical protein
MQVVTLRIILKSNEIIKINEKELMEKETKLTFIALE